MAKVVSSSPKSATGNKNPNKVFIFAAAVVFIAIIGAVAYINISKSQNLETKIVATVNSETVTAREFKFRMERGRGRVAQFFKDKYHLNETSPAFWTSKYGDQTPMEYARKQTLDDIVRIKVQQLLGKQRKLVDDISYTAFLKNLDRENKSRKEASENGQPVYGLLEYGEENYFERLFVEMVDKLTMKLVNEKKIVVTDNDIKAYYDANKEKEFAKQDSLKIERIFVDFSYGDVAAGKNAKSAIEKINTRIIKGEKFDNIVKNIKAGSESQVKYADVNIDDKTEIIDIDNILHVRDAARQLELNKASGIIAEDTSFNIIRCTARKDNGFRPLTDTTVRNFIKSKLTEEKYNQYIDEQVKLADVNIKEKIYNSMEIDKKYR